MMQKNNNFDDLIFSPLLPPHIDQMVMIEQECFSVKLVTIMMGLMKHMGVASVLLEVRESNLPAQNCYAQAGFTVVGRRKNYYELPKEDALLMGRELV